LNPVWILSFVALWVVVAVLGLVVLALASEVTATHKTIDSLRSMMMHSACSGCKCNGNGAMKDPEETQVEYSR
jgi:hypothetical protein